MLNEKIDRVLKPLLDAKLKAGRRVEMLDQTIAQTRRERITIETAVTARREYDAARQSLERVEKQLAQANTTLAEVQRRYAAQKARCEELEDALAGTRRDDHEAARRLDQLATVEAERSRFAKERAEADSHANTVAGNLLDEALSMTYKALVDYRTAHASRPHGPEWDKRRRQDPNLNSLLDLFEHERAAYRAAEHRHDHVNGDRHADRMSEVAAQVNSEYPGAMDALYAPEGLERYIHTLELFYSPTPDERGTDIVLPTPPNVWKNLKAQPSLSEGDEGIVATHLCWSLARALGVKLSACNPVLGKGCVALRCSNIPYDEVPSGAFADVRLPGAPSVRLAIQPLPSELLGAFRNASRA